MVAFFEKITDSYDFIDTDYHSEPTLAEIASEWNSNVLMRAYEIEAGIDITYLNVIVPKIQETLHRLAPQKAKVLDVGCGLGNLTNIISESGYNVTGIDIAGKAIEYANTNFPNVEFEHASIVDFSWKSVGSYDICLANMVLHNLIDINDNLLAIYRLLKNGGYVIASIPDPKYWFDKHIKEPKSSSNLSGKWIRKVPFKIKRGITHPSPITYIHRPLSQYQQFIENAGFEILESEHPIKKNGQFDYDLLFCVWQK